MVCGVHATRWVVHTYTGHCIHHLVHGRLLTGSCLNSGGLDGVDSDGGRRLWEGKRKSPVCVTPTEHGQCRGEGKDSGDTGRVNDSVKTVFTSEDPFHLRVRNLPNANRVS